MCTLVRYKALAGLIWPLFQAKPLASLSRGVTVRARYARAVRVLLPHLAATRSAAIMRDALERASSAFLWKGLSQEFLRDLILKLSV